MILICVIKGATNAYCPQVDRLIAGEVGYLAASIKAVADARVGDTLTSKKNGATQALPGTLAHLPLPCTVDEKHSTKLYVSHGQEGTRQRLTADRATWSWWVQRRLPSGWHLVSSQNLMAAKLVPLSLFGVQ